MCSIIFEKSKKQTVILPYHRADSLRTDEKINVSKEDWLSAMKVSVFSLIITLVVMWCANHTDQGEFSTSTADSPTTNDMSYCDALDEDRCLNGGMLMKAGDAFECQCPRGYHGERCADDEKPAWKISWLIGGDEDVRRGAPSTWWWSFLPFTETLMQKTVISFHQNQLKRIMGDRWFLADARENDEGDVMTRVAAPRLLPVSHPMYCRADEKLPPLNTVYNQMFRRKSDDGLIRDPKRRNLLLHTFYQYFVLQFFDADFSATVTGSQLYGTDEETQRGFRSFSGGKLKSEHLNGEEYPPRRSFAEKLLLFTSTEPFGKTTWLNRVATEDTLQDPLISAVMAFYDTLKPQWAVANPLLETNPLLFAMSTLWLREHNRVCDELVSQWPTWTDDQVYAVAKKTVLGEMMVIMTNEIMTAINPFSLKHDPKTYPDPSTNNCSFTTPLELLLTTILPSGLPGELDDVKVAHPKPINDNSQVSGSGVSEMVRLMVDQEMGLMTSNNDGATTKRLTKRLMKLSRENAVQSFNNYRRHFGLHAYKSFYELTGNRETASKLDSLYGDVEKVELLTGLLAEKKSDDFVPTFTVLSNSIIINSIITNPLNSKSMWKSDTFGGDAGFNLVKSANIKKFICNNLIDKCSDDFVIDLYAK